MDPFLRAVDLPMGRRFPRKHPKRQQLTQLILHNAPEYERAPQTTGFQSKEHGRFIRSKSDIITSVVNELMPREEGGRYMIKDENSGAWVARVGFDCMTREVRYMIQERFNKLIRTWNGNLPPLPPRTQPQSLEEAHAPLHSNGAQGEMHDEEARKEANCNNEIPGREDELQIAGLSNQGNDVQNNTIDPPTAESVESIASDVDFLSIFNDDTSMTSSQFVRGITCINQEPRRSAPDYDEAVESAQVRGAFSNVGNLKPPTSATEASNKRIRSGATVYSTEPVIHRRGCSSYRSTSAAPDLIGLMDGADSAHDGGSSDSFLTMICTRLSWSVSLKEPSTLSSLSRSQSAPSLLATGSVAIERVRGAESSDAPGGFNPMPPIFQRSKEEVGQLALPSVKLAIDGGHISIVRKNAGPVNRGDLSTVSGLGNLGGTCIKGLLSDLTNCWLNVNTINQFLDDLSDRAINEDRELTEEGVTNRAVGVVSSVMKNHLETRSVILKAFTLVIQLYGNHDSIPVSQSYIAQTMRALQTHSNDAHLLVNGWWLLRVLATRDSNARYGIAKEDGIALILNGMSQHSNDGDIQAEGCYVLGELTFDNPENQRKIAGADGIGLILKAMQRHACHAEVQKCGCWVLRRLAYKSPQNQRLIANANGVGVILQAMQQHHAMAHCNKRDCHAALVDQIAFEDPENQRTIADANGIAVIRQAMLHFPKGPDVQYFGARALVAITTGEWNTPPHDFGEAMNPC